MSAPSIAWRILGAGVAVILSCGVGATASPESSGRQLQQLVDQLQKTPDDNTLREKIAGLVAAMQPKPVVPEDARGHFIKAVYLQKHAATPADYKLVIDEYQKALLIAPWWPDANNALAGALELTQQYAAAVEALKLTVMADPHGPAARAAQDKMYVVEAEQEKTAAERASNENAQAAQSAAAAQQAQAQTLAEAFRGVWYANVCRTGSDNFSCTDRQRASNSWMPFSTDFSSGPMQMGFTLPGNGTVVLSEWVGWAWCWGNTSGYKAGVVVGIPQGSSFASIRWEVRPKDGPTRQVYSEISDDASNLTISCDRPLTGANPNVQYRYVWFHRQLNAK